MTLSRFVNVYNSLPLAERNLPAVVIDGEAISWNLCYEEIKNNTELGKRIQVQLEQLKLI